MENYTCVICNHFCATSMTGVLKHIGLVNAHEPNVHVSCGIQGCPLHAHTRTITLFVSTFNVDIKIVW